MSVETNNNIIPQFNPSPSRCSFWVAPKKRFCQFEVRKNSKYCGNHLPIEEQLQQQLQNNQQGEDMNNSSKTSSSSKLRIPCPLNPNHTIFQCDLAKHLKICPDGRYDVTKLPYYVKSLHSSSPSSNLNCVKMKNGDDDDSDKQDRINENRCVVPIRTDEKFSSEHTSHKFLEQEELLKVWKVISRVFKQFVVPDLDLEGNEWIQRSLHLEQQQHNEDNGKKWKPSCSLLKFSENSQQQQRSTTSKKHGLQHQALVQMMIDIGAIGAADVFVELGAGKGGLALAVADAIVMMPTTSKNDEDSSIPSSKLPQIIVADRGGFRRKADARVGNNDINKNKNIINNNNDDDDKEVEEQNKQQLIGDNYPSFQRLRIDVQDLDLFKVPLSTNTSTTTQKNNSSHPASAAAVIGKHLCGACTDFTISACLFGSEKKSENLDNSFIQSVDWIMIATCCHHRCERKYFEILIEKVMVMNNEKLSESWEKLLKCFDAVKPNEIFGPLVSLTSWATCGHARRQRREEGNDENDEHENNNNHQEEEEIAEDEVAETKSVLPIQEFMGSDETLPLSPIERERAGRMCKLILDWMRCQIIKKSGKFDHVELVPFLPPSGSQSDDLGVTKENWVILAWN